MESHPLIWNAAEVCVCVCAVHSFTAMVPGLVVKATAAKHESNGIFYFFLQNGNSK